MFPRLDDNLTNNPISRTIPTISSINRSSNSFTQSESTELKNSNNFKDLTNLSNLKENIYSISDSTMKLDLVIYDGSIPSTYTKLQSNTLTNKLTNDTTTSNSDYVQSTSDKNYSKSINNDLNSVEKENQSIINNHLDNQQKQLGLIGLTNLGNTCYMNSGLQCLFNNKKLIVFFLNEYLKSSSKLNLANNSLTSCFVSLMKKVWNFKRDYNVIKPYEFKEIMSQNYSQFQGFRQHDCQEFLSLLLGTLHDQINQGLKLEQTKSINGEMISSGKEESPLSNCSNDLMDLSSRTTSPKSSLSVSTSSTYCDQLSEEEIDNNGTQNVTLVAADDKKDESQIFNEKLVNNQTVINPIQRLMNYNKSSIKTISKDDFKNSLQLSVKELTSKDTKLSNTNLHTDLNQELAYDSKKFNKTTIENELICSTAKQLSNQIVDNNEDYLDRYSDNASTTSSTTSILKKSKKRNNPSSSSSTNHLNNKNLNNELDSIVDQNDLDEKYNSPKRMKTDTDHDSSNEQFENSINEKFSSELEWTKYLTKNKSIIVDTFQGQFKSTVKCSKCLNVSITYEPFMYLPVTLPNALQRQIFVTFIPSSSNVLYSNDIKPARRYLITLNKHDKLDKLSNSLKVLLIKDQIATENTQLCFAEVDEKFIYKVLDNNTFLKYVDDKFRDLYAFEMVELSFTTTYPTIAMPEIWESNQPTTIDLIGSQMPADQNLLTPNSDYDFNSQNSFINNRIFLNEPLIGFYPSTTTIGCENKPSFSNSLNNEINLVNNQIDENKLTSSFSTDYLTNSNFNKKFIDYSNNDDKLTQDSNPLDDNLKDGDTNNLKIDLNPSNFDNDKSDTLQIYDTFDNCNLLPIPLSCAICLEEKDSSQLLIHTACSCQLCSPCLDMTVKHCSENETNFLCPTCSQYIDKSDFVPFGSKKQDQGIFTTSYYFIPILFRIQEKRNYNNFKLVTRPILLRLPSLLSGRELYEIIDRFVPCPSPYSLCFVSKNGQKCSRCDWNGNCNGCEITRIGDVFIQPKDNIAVEFVNDSYSPELESMIPDTMKQILDDPSVHDYKKPEKLTLHKCLKSFNQSEVLDDDNPWFCTVCNSNQKARKSLTIWKSPDTLIVYLKRFVFHDMNSIKVDESVEFPIEKFDISPYYQADNKFKEDNSNEELIYDLKSIICHSGGVNSGHYTAFSKSCWNNKWYYFNDESVLELEPSPSDERAYILFYEKISPGVALNFDSLKFKQNS